MGGAFTAVADDATASWWNPAGMAGGAYFNALIEAGNHREPHSERTAAGDPQTRAARRYAQFCRRLSGPRPELLPPAHQRNTAANLYRTAAAGDRQEGGATEVRLRSLVLNQFGATVGQSLGSHLVIGSTVKLVHARARRRSFGRGGRARWTRRTTSIRRGRRKAGLDIGAMATFGRCEVGVMVRNVTEPEFGSGIDAFTLTRHGARWARRCSSGTRGVIGSATVAVDADLTTTSTVFGDERRVAAGGEVWTTARTFGMRGGVEREHDRRRSGRR